MSISDSFSFLFFFKKNKNILPVTKRLYLKSLRSQGRVKMIDRHKRIINIQRHGYQILQTYLQNCKRIFSKKVFHFTEFIIRFPFAFAASPGTLDGFYLFDALEH